MTQTTEQLAAAQIAAGLRKWWWIPLVQGIAALVVGMLLFGRPLKTLAVLVTWVGAYWLIEGIVQVIGAMMGTVRGSRLWAVLSGLIGILGGLFALTYPMYAGAATMDFIVDVFGVGLIISGLVQLFTGRAVSGNTIEQRTWGKRLVGVLYIIGGALLISHSGIAVVTLLSMFAFWLIFVGFLQIFAAFEIKKI